MLLDKIMFQKIKDNLAEDYRKAAKTIDELEIEGFNLFETSNNTFIGEVIGVKNNNLIVKIIAARVVNFKIRNLSKKGFKLRTYPLTLSEVISSKVIKNDEVPLYLNFKYLSPQFKNRFLKLYINKKLDREPQSD